MPGGSARLKLKRIKNREYAETSRQIIRPAEYAVLRGGKRIAVIVFNGIGWRAGLPSGESRIGSAVSPVDLDKFKAVKLWILDYLGEENEK